MASKIFLIVVFVRNFRALNGHSARVRSRRRWWSSPDPRLAWNKKYCCV